MFEASVKEVEAADNNFHGVFPVLDYQPMLAVNHLLNTPSTGSLSLDPKSMVTRLHRNMILARIFMK